MVETARRDAIRIISPEAVARERVARRHKVLKIAPTSFFADYGCHVRILEETFALQQLRSRVVICTYRSGRDIAGIDIRRGLGFPWANGIKVGSSKRKVIFDAWLSVKAFATALEFQPDVVHAHLHEGALIGYPLSKFYRVPLIFDFQGSLTSEMIDHNFLRRESVFYGPLRGLERIINRKATAIITSTANAADVLVRDFGVDHRRIHPVPDCVNPARFKPRWEFDQQDKAALRAQLGIPQERKVVVYLGLLAEYQGSSHLLQAASLLCRRRRDVHFLLMGYPGQGRYRELARALGIEDRVTLPGRIPYEQAPLYLAIGDIAVAPKMSATEGNGKLLNYMACGLPIVAFDTPVSREILAELGVYARLGDSADLARCLEMLLVDEAQAAELGRELRARVLKHFVWANAARKILEVYDRAAGR